MQTVRPAGEQNSKFVAEADRIVSRYKQKLIAHHDYIRKHGEDMPEILNWKWT